MRKSPTRGFGYLELYLARKRAKIANKLIGQHHEQGRALDIGCGVNPYFLRNTKYVEKHGLDNIEVMEAAELEKAKIHITNFDLNKDETLPYDNDYFDLVSMLAVLEHIDPKRAISIFCEVLRTLKSGGILVLTTPAAWTDSLLRTLARLRLVSKEEIDDHKYKYTPSIVKFMLECAGFEDSKVELGYFELFMNMWAKATV